MQKLAVLYEPKCNRRLANMMWRLFTLCLLTQFPVGRSVGQTSRLIYTDLYSTYFALQSNVRLINQTTDVLYQTLQSDGDADVVILHPGNLEFNSALTFDIDDEFIFWGDTFNKAIMKMDLKTNDVTMLYDGVSVGLGDLAVDWVANNVYWSDSSYNWIMMSDYNGQFHHVVVNTGLDEPSGIAVDPMNSKIYWADWRGNARIESATLLGNNRTTLVGGYEDFGIPHGLTLDYENRRLYWTDVQNEAVYSVDVDAAPGQMDVKLEYGDAGLFYPVFMDLDKNYLFISEYEYDYIMIIPRDNATYDNAAFYPTGTWKPAALAFYDVTRQPPHENMCAVDNGGCDQLCISTPDINSDHCLCTAGYVMDSNGTCVKDTHLIPGHKLIIADSVDICSSPVNLADVQDLSGLLTCFLQASVSSFDYDFQQEMLYVYMPYDAAIKRVRLRENEIFETIHENIQDVGGIAVDWISATLYWTETMNNKIMISRLDGLYKSIIADVDNPLAIGVHPLKEYLFWGVGGSDPCIERSSLSGRHRIKLVTEGIIQPVAMAVDYDKNRLYWTDNGSWKLESVAIDGNLREVISDSYSRVTFGGVTSYQEFLMWTEKEENHLVLYETGTDSVSRTLALPDTPGALKVYDERMQPRLNATNPCFYTSCSGICVPYNGIEDCICEVDTPSCTRAVYCLSSVLHGSIQSGCDTSQGKSCPYACDNGFHATYTGQLFCTDTGKWDRDVDTLCKLEISLDHFMLVGSPDKIYYVDLTSPNNSHLALPLPDLEYMLGFDFDFIDNLLYWTDISLQSVNKISLDGSNADVVVHSDLIYPDGIEIDSVNRKVYWVDSETDRVEVANLDGTDRGAIVYYNLDEPRALVLDEENQVLYWTDWGDAAKIEKVNVDGTGRETVVFGNLSHPLGIELDRKEGRLYWCDASLDVLESCNTDGSDRKIVHEFESSYACYGIALTEDYIYWTDYFDGNIHRLTRNARATRSTRVTRSTLQDEIFLPDLEIDDAMEIKIFTKPTAMTSTTQFAKVDSTTITTHEPVKVTTESTTITTHEPVKVTTTNAVEITTSNDVKTTGVNVIETTKSIEVHTTKSGAVKTTKAKDAKSTKATDVKPTGDPKTDKRIGNSGDTGVLIGVAVASIIISIIVIAIAAMYFCRRRQRKSDHDMQGIEQPVYYTVDEGDQIRGVGNPVYDNIDSYQFETNFGSGEMATKAVMVDGDQQTGGDNKNHYTNH
ncbi:low-density lipoprotein receptor-related protein 6-like [Glandiceps talaboti]